MDVKQLFQDAIKLVEFAIKLKTVIYNVQVVEMMVPFAKLMTLVNVVLDLQD